MPAEALVLPADARFVMGFDVKRFTSSPFYARYASQRGMQPGCAAGARGEDRDQPRPRRRPDRDRGDERDRRRLPGRRPGDGPLRPVQARAHAGDRGQGGRVQPRRRHRVRLQAGRRHRPMAIAFLDEGTLLFGQKARVEAAVSSHTRGEAPFRKNAVLMALAEKVRPGSTFWMVGDQSLLAGMPTSVPAPGASGDGAMISLPALKSLTVTGDLDPQVSLAITGEATDERRGEEPGGRGARLRGDHEPAGAAEAGATAAGLGRHRRHPGQPGARLRPHSLRAAGRSPAEGQGGAGTGDRRSRRSALSFRGALSGRATRNPQSRRR